MVAENSREQSLPTEQIVVQINVQVFQTTANEAPTHVALQR